jgi:outer membrane protein assembly factor BamB
MNNESISEAEEKLRKLLDVACNEVVKPLWRYPTKDWVSSVYAADVDGDGDIEAVIGSRDSSVYVVSKLGGEKWPTPFVQPKKWAGAVWAIEYVGPNHPHIFAGSRDSNVYALDELGRLVWQEATGHVVRSLWVADIDADGIPEVVAGSEDRCVHAFNAFTGERKWSYETNGWIRTVVAYDIDGNGKCEIIAGSGDKKLYFITSDGQTFLKPIFTGSKIHSLYAGEIGEGGSPKIVVSSDAKDLYVLDLETLDKQPLEKEWVFWPENRILCISAVDITGDGLEEIVAGSEDKHIYFLDPRKKKLLWKHYVGYRVFCMYPVDINRDGRPELIIGGEDRCAHVANVYLQTGLLDQIKGLATKIGIDRLTTVPSNDEQRFELQGILYGVDEQKLAASLDVLEPIASPELPNTLEDLLMLEHQHAKLVWREEVGLVRSIALGDIDGDGRLEVGMGTDDGDVIVVDDDGKRMWIGMALWKS